MNARQHLGHLAVGPRDRGLELGAMVGAELRRHPVDRFDGVGRAGHGLGVGEVRHPRLEVVDDVALDAVVGEDERRRAVVVADRPGALDARRGVRTGEPVAAQPGDPIENLPPIGRVYNHQNLGIQSVHHNIVEDAAIVGAAQRVLRTTGCQSRNVVRSERLDECQRIRAAKPQPSHVREIEQADCRANGGVLGDDALILNWHLPAAELDESRTGRHVLIKQRGTRKR